MQICPTKADFRAVIAGLRQEGASSVGLVPTMGFLHDGHIALIRASAAACTHTTVSIFVNPTQFGDPADLEAYPRDTPRDLAILRAEGVAAVFLPDPAEMYHPEAQSVVDSTELSTTLMGALRPGHFQGVATVVTKLLNIAQPDRVYFGRKDYQQLAVIRTIVRDLDVPVEVYGVATVREADGLAMSSRNVHLTPTDRASAVALNAALDWAEEAAAMSSITAEEMAATVTAHIAEAEGAEVQSVDVRNADTLAPVSGPLTAPAVLLLAVRFGAVLLIDQRVVTP